MLARPMKSPPLHLTRALQALEWLMQLAEALSYLHSAIPMVIHRDLKLVSSVQPVSAVPFLCTAPCPRSKMTQNC